MSWKYFKTAKADVSKERKLVVIQAPHVTEKATMSSQFNSYVFKVDVTATKPEIKSAIEELFKVNVVSVNTINQIGKEKRFRHRKGRRPDWRKAVVRLKDGETIDIGAGV